MVAWAKQDPTRTDSKVPDEVQKFFPDYKGVFEKYGREIYGFYAPTFDKRGTEDALSAFLDLLIEERGYKPMARAEASYRTIRAEWFPFILPEVGRGETTELLSKRQFIIL